MVKRGLTDIQLQVLTSIAENGVQHIQGIQLSEGLNYATANRSVKMLEKLSLVHLSSHDESQGPKAPKYYGLTPLGAVEAFLRGGNDINIFKLLGHWGEVSPRYIHNWWNFEDDLREHLWECLWRLYPERVVHNRILPLGLHVILYDYIKPERFTVIRDGLDGDLLEVAVNGISDKERMSFMMVVSGDPRYLGVWSNWFQGQENRFKHVRGLNEGIQRLLKH